MVGNTKWNNWIIKTSTRSSSWYGLANSNILRPTIHRHFRGFLLSYHPPSDGIRFPTFTQCEQNRSKQLPFWLLFSLRLKMTAWSSVRGQPFQVARINQCQLLWVANQLNHSPSSLHSPPNKTPLDYGDDSGVCLHLDSSRVMLWLINSRS